MILLPIMTKCGLERKKAHATCVCVIFALCAFSAVLYLRAGRVSLADISPYIIWGLFGAISGSLILQKINQRLLRKIFGAFMIWAAYRMVF